MSENLAKKPNILIEIKKSLNCTQVDTYQVDCTPKFETDWTMDIQGAHSVLEHIKWKWNKQFVSNFQDISITILACSILSFIEIGQVVGPQLG